MRTLIKIDLSRFPNLVNRMYHKTFNNESHFLVMYGGAGSGKSVTAAQKIIYRMLTERDHRYLVGRKVGDTIRDSSRAEIIAAIEDMGVRELFTYSESPTGEMTIKCPNNNVILFRGFDNVEKLKSIKGISSAWLEEASEFTEDDLDQLNLRIRGKGLRNYKQIILTFNPISEHHWLKKRFFDRIDPKATVIKTTYRDNVFIDDEYKESLEALKDTNETYYKVYALGEWGTLKGAIYDNYTVIDAMPDYAEIDVLGLDFGYNHPQSLVRIKIDGNDAYIDEIYYESGHDNRYFIEHIAKHHADIKHLKCWADAARPDLIDELQRAGWSIEKAKKDVFAGINTVKGLKLHITARSVNILREIKTYCWKQDKDGNTLDEPVKTGDDAMDAMRYAIFSELAKPDGTTKSFQIKGL